MPDSEGWTYLHNSPKWHYFRKGLSMCGRFMLLQNPSEGFETGNNASKSNCRGCIRELEKAAMRLAKARGESDAPGI
jgi:hypothetical protein